MKIGVQLYTLREYAKNLTDFAETLDRVADMGYTTVQVSGTCAYEADWLAEQLKRTGLTCGITHYDFGRIVNDTEKTVEFHNKFGCKCIGIGGMPGVFGNDDIKTAYSAFVEKSLPASEKIKDLGSIFMYHNHNHEYLKSFDGMNVMEHLEKDFPVGTLGFTLDTYWVKAGNADPVEWLRRFAGRIPCIHYKDMKIMDDGTKRFAPIGYGILDFEKITEAAVEGGTEYAYVELDDCYGENPFDALKKSYDYLKSIGLD